MKRAIFLDRDGVLNKTIWRMGKPRAPYTIDEFELFPGVIEATKNLKERGFLLIVVTNQPDVARGWVEMDSVEAVNSKLKDLIEFDDIRICYHDTGEGCDCRKPKPGMILESAKIHHIDLENSFMIGDRYSDIEAGRSAGCKTILIGDGDEAGTVMPHYQKDSLIEASRLILNELS